MPINKDRPVRLLLASVLIGTMAALIAGCHSQPPVRTGITESTPKSAPIVPLGRINQLTCSDLSGKNYPPASFTAHKANLFLFLSGQCPVCNVYAPRLCALAHDYAARGVQVFAVYPDRQESRADIDAYARSHGFSFPIVKDENNKLADQLGASYTPQAVLIDAEGGIRYRGRIDDNAIVTRVTTHDLTDALDAVLAGKQVEHPEMPAFGCIIRRASAPSVAKAGTPTYAHDVAPILRAKCEKCHRSGEVAPFSLQNYKQASAWAADIKRYTQNGQMPPWQLAPDYGEFANTRASVLTDQERMTLAKWTDGGAPLGDPKQIPPPRQFPKGWKLGTPDMIVSPEREYHLSADGEDVYRMFVMKADFDRDRWLRAAEFRPGNRAVVHHAAGFIDVTGTAEKLEAATHDGQPGYISFGTPGFNARSILDGWAPGNDPVPMPDGTAIKLPKGCRLVIQIHYHKDGKPETDRTQVGLYFAKTAVKKEIGFQVALNTKFRIPPGAANYEVDSTLKINEDCHLYSLRPHMHLLGKDMKLWAQLPGKKEPTPLIWVKRWDFNWQATYPLQTPIALPAGTVVYLTAHYDNSVNNLRNPNRLNPHEVTIGAGTTDEMCVCLLNTTRDAEHLVARLQ